jgi:CubicO group peptidase (beta-lactamase class C family)
LWELDSLEEFSRRAATLPLASQPGEAFVYGISTDLLGRVIEVAAGQPFDQVVAAVITGPLAMTDTAFFVPEEKRGRLAVIYSAGENGDLAPAPPGLGAHADEGEGFPSGGAGLFSTADDFARFAQMLLNGGELDGHRVLARKTVELMTTVNHIAGLGGGTHQFSDANGFGLGVEVRTRLDRGPSPGSLGQFGWYGAATTYVNIDKNERTVALLFAQHFPFDEHGLFARFSTLHYAALR